MPSGPMLSSQSLRMPRACRIKQGRDFIRLKNKGNRLVCGCLILNWLSQEGTTHKRLGVVISRKVGNSVVRSRARRLLREVWRCNQHSLPSCLDVILIARASIVDKSMQEVERDYLTALKRAGILKKNEPGTTPRHS